MGTAQKPDEDDLKAYVINNTTMVLQTIRDLKQSLGSGVKRLQNWFEKALRNGESLLETTLSVKVLDPSMGWGNFLIAVVDFLADKLVLASNRDKERGSLAKNKKYTLKLAKKEIISNCIYGVDLDKKAVEIAKIVLWLNSLSEDNENISLEHKLKVGNSLIGFNWGNGTFRFQ